MSENKSGLSAPDRVAYEPIVDSVRILQISGCALVAAVLSVMAAAGNRRVASA
jgi:hypothetical protein